MNNQALIKVDFNSWARYEIEKAINETKNTFIQIVDIHGVAKKTNDWYFGYELYVVNYSTEEQFKKVVHDLVEAIKRGNKTFILPADKNTDKKSAPKNVF